MTFGQIFQFGKCSLTTSSIKHQALEIMGLQMCVHATSLDSDLAASFRDQAQSFVMIRRNKPGIIFV